MESWRAAWEFYGMEMGITWRAKENELPLLGRPKQERLMVVVMIVCILGGREEKQ